MNSTSFTIILDSFSHTLQKLSFQNEAQYNLSHQKIDHKFKNRMFIKVKIKRLI
jgi:hypothetical protein